MTRSVLSAYARGRRQPGVDAIARIAAAGGLEVRVDVPAGAGTSERRPTGRGDAAADPARAAAAARMAATRAAWARGAAEGKQLDRLRAKRLSYAQRIDEGLALTRVADQLQAGRASFEQP